MSDKTYFELPVSPDAFGVSLDPAQLRRIDFSGLDYDTALRSIVEYVKTYYPMEFNDFVSSNGFVMMMEIVAAAVAKLSLRADILSNEGTMPTCTTEEALSNHLALINQKIRRQTPAVAEIECTIANPVSTDIRIPAGTSFSVKGQGQSELKYELYRAPGDYDGDIVIPAGKRGVIGLGVQGEFAAPVQFTSDGGSYQVYQVSEPSILESPIFCRVITGSGVDEVSEDWTVVLDPVERYGPLDKVVEAVFLGGNAVFRFGNNQNGAAPLSGQVVEFRYRVGGGSVGRIGIGQVDEARQLVAQPPASSPVQVRFRNIAASSGGTDRESLSEAKRRAPKDYAMRTGIVTPDDYAHAAQSFSHPAFGSVVKAVATLRTSKNANLVEVYCLAAGPDGMPTAPNAGLKAGLKTYYEQRCVATDHVEILDGRLRPVDVDMVVIMNRSVDAAVVKTKVEKTISDFFDQGNWQMGQPLYFSNLVEAVQSIDGVNYVNLYSPADNLLPGREDGVMFDQMVVEGKRQVQYYYEKSSRQ